MFRNGRSIPRHNWTEADKEYIRAEYRYTIDSFSRLIREFGVTADALRQILSRLGLVKYTKLWTPKEEEFVRGNYNKLPTVAIARKLKRSEGAVRFKVHKLNLSKFERDGWFTATEVRRILGVSQEWLKRRLNNGFKFDMRPFNPDRIPTQGNHTPWVIAEKSLRNWIRRYPEELCGRNVDWPTIVEILAGIKVDIAEIKTDVKGYCLETVEEETE